MYAQDTSVPVEKSRAEIERLLMQHGADKFMVGSDSAKAMLAFQIRGKMIQFTLPLPDKSDKRFRTTPTGRIKRNENAAYEGWEQACRSRWRALFLCIKAKIEAVECGITSFESEFLAHFVMPDGKTIGERLLPKLEDATSKGIMPRLMLTQGDD